MNKVTLFDYNADWALNEHYIEPRSIPGYLTREEVIAFYGTLGVDGIEIRDEYWSDCSPKHLQQLTSDAGLPIVTYLFCIDLAKPAGERQTTVDQTRSLLDRTAEMGASFAFVIPAIVKEDVALEQQRAWLIEGLRQCAEHAESVGVTILCENCDYPPIRPLMGRGADCRDICAAVASTRFRLIYDVAAPLFVEDDSLATLREMAPYVAHVHLKNSRPLVPGEHTARYLDSNSGQRYTGTLLDTGTLELEPILTELHRIQYCGYLLIEYQGEEDPRTALHHNVECLRLLTESVRHKK